MISALSTINTVQGQYSRNERLVMMHVDRAIPVFGGIMRLWFLQ